MRAESYSTHFVRIEGMVLKRFWMIEKGRGCMMRAKSKQPDLFTSSWMKNLKMRKIPNSSKS
jgi:hypothetical protein